MAYYEKKVVYLSEMEYGRKIKGAGFVRMEFRGEACFLDMHISGMTEVPDKKYDVCVVLSSGKEYEIGKVYIHNGKGEWKEQYENGCLNEKCIIEELLVKISDSKTISGKTGFVNRRTDMKAAQIAEEQKEKSCWSERAGRRWEFRRSEPKNKITHMPDSAEKKEPEYTNVAATENEGNKVERNKIEQDKVEQNVRNRNQVELNEIERDEIEQNEAKQQEIQMDTIILNDKWDQLRQIYPIIHPYEDDREYISIQPKDFVIMTGDYQHLANNSFLLHGFYNYRYIILGRERDGFFYLGVPGVYYEREKMVALMFGFEAFECSGGMAEAGKSGYYLRKVQI